MSLKIYNISKGELEEEKVCAEKLMRFLYGGKMGEAALWLLISRGIFSKACGLWADSKISRKAVERFIRENEIETSEMLKEPGEYNTFNEFFTRALKSGARKIELSGEKNVVSFPSDGRHLLVRGIGENDSFYAKGQRFNLGKFLGDAALAERYVGGDMLISRLSPMDYHRFHYPVSGEICARRVVAGKLYSVSPIALVKRLSIIWENKRVVNLLETEEMGVCAFVEIGATNVGTIVNFDKVSARVDRGAEAGMFRFGGSCVVSIFERGANIKWRKELEEKSLENIESYARVGEFAGRAVAKE